MDMLPTELWFQIATHLDVEPPSIAKFAHEPSEHLTECNSTPLKSLSMASWRWRKITLPILFRYTRTALDKEPQWVPIDARQVDSMQAQLTKLSNHEFKIYQSMRSKFKSSSSSAYAQSFDDLLIKLCRIQDGDECMKAAPQILWLPHLPKTFEAFGKFVTQNDLKRHIKSVVIYTDKEYELGYVSEADVAPALAVAEIWVTIFRYLEPTRVVVAAPPTTLAKLLDTQVASQDTWAFEMEMHYVELIQPEPDPSRVEHSKACCRGQNEALIDQRPWTHLGYNEGSSITAYSTYEFHSKQSPQILHRILNRLAEEVQPCCNITSFSFTGIFPFFGTIAAINKELRRISTLKQVAFQLAPGQENNALDDPERVGRAQRSDFWLEWNESHKFIAGFLLTFHSQGGAEFKSNDCWNERLAQDVSEHFKHLQALGADWRKRSEETGFWIRDHGPDRDVGPVISLGIL